MSASMLAPAEGAIAKLALVLLLGGRSLLGRRVIGGRGGRGHTRDRCDRTARSSQIGGSGEKDGGIVP